MKLTQTQARKVLNSKQALNFGGATCDLLNLIAEGTIKNAEVDFAIDAATINNILGRKPKPALLEPETKLARDQITDFMFIVYAHAGRLNGWALVVANNKTEARKFARQSGWLTTGTVDNAVTVRQYLEDMGDDVETGVAELLEDFPESDSIGSVSEIDWGT